MILLHKLLIDWFNIETRLFLTHLLTWMNITDLSHELHSRQRPRCHHWHHLILSLFVIIIICILRHWLWWRHKEKGWQEMFFLVVAYLGCRYLIVHHTESRCHNGMRWLRFTLFIFLLNSFLIMVLFFFLMIINTIQNFILWLKIKSWSLHRRLLIFLLRLLN